MRRINILIVAVAGLCSATSARAASNAYSEAVTADHPTVYYRFEEAAGASEAADSSASGHNGTYSEVGLGNASFNSVLGNAAEFNGDTSNVAVPELGPAGEFTIEAWIKPNDFSTWEVIYNSDGYDPGATHFQLIDDDKVEFSVSGNTTEDVDFGDSSVFGAGRWSYLVLTYSATDKVVSVFANGSLINKNVYSVAVPAAFPSGHMGAWNGTDRQFDGLIDEFAIYPRILTPAQIQAHYLAAVGSFVSISTHPSEAAVFAGSSATFSAAATVVGSSEQPRFQWQRNAVDIPGATNSAYTTPLLTLADNGARYRAVVTVPGSSATATTEEAQVSVTSLPPTGYADAVKADNPILYYRFEESTGTNGAADSSSGSHKGTYNNVVLGNASFNAVLGSAARFDGSSSGVAVPSLGNAIRFSVEAWIRPDIYKDQETVYTADQIAPGAAVAELMDDAGVRFSLEGNGPSDMGFGDESAFAGDWSYVVVTYDSSTSKATAYVNGETVATMSYSEALPAELGAGHIGAGNGPNSMYRGLIDEVAIYDHVLTQDQILAHYATAIGPIVTPQPQDQAIFTSNAVTFVAGVITGFKETPHFQWQRNGIDIPGATNSSYTTPVLTVGDDGAHFHAQITVASGALTTREASVSVTSLSPTGYFDAVRADNPILYYRFEENSGAENAVDSSSSGANGGTYDNVSLGQASFNAVLGHAALFDGGSIEVPELAEAAQFTLEAWIKPDVFEEFNAIYTTDEYPDRAVHFQLIDDERVALSLNGTDPEDAEFGGDSVFAVSQWRHVAVTYDASAARAIMYVNGSPVGTNTYTATVPGGFEAAHIGAWNGDERFYFGLIDEFAIYNKVLTPVRIQAHYVAAAGATVARPELKIQRVADQITVSWSDGGVLQENSSLADPTAWTNVPAVSGSPATITVGTGNRFYGVKR